MAYSVDGQILASASFDKSICIFMVNDGSVLKILHPLNTTKRPLQFSLDQTFLFLGEEQFATEITPSSMPSSIRKSRYSSLYFKNAWIMSLATQKRITWVPQEFYGRIMATNTGAVIQTGQKDLLFLDFSALILNL